MADQVSTHNKFSMMLDLETLGTNAGCPVTEIGLVVFDTKTYKSLAEFHVCLSASVQMRRGAVLDRDTEQWWREQDPEKLARMMADVSAVEPRLLSLLNFCNTWQPDFDICDGVFAQGQDFDFPILKAMLKMYGHEMPWQYGLHRDTRTVYAEADFDYREAPRIGAHHSALDDCLTQISHLGMARDKLRNDMLKSIADG